MARGPREIKAPPLVWRWRGGLGGREWVGARADGSSWGQQDRLGAGGGASYGWGVGRTPWVHPRSVVVVVVPNRPGSAPVRLQARKRTGQLAAILLLKLCTTRRSRYREGSHAATGNTKRFQAVRSVRIADLCVSVYTKSLNTEGGYNT